MEVAKIIYYTRVGDKNKTVPLKEINLREEYYLEDVFYAIRDAIDENDLLERFKRILCDEVELDTVNAHYLRYAITDMNGNINYLKFKQKGE